MKTSDIARLAGVSTATVSRALNDSELVRPETMQHVKRIVAELGYIPNNNARSLRIGKSKLFGLIVSDIQNPYFPELIDKFESLAAQKGIDVIFTHTNYDLDRQEHCLRRLLERNVDGIAVMTSEVHVKALTAIAQATTPLVLLNQPILKSQFNDIAVDYMPGFREAIGYLKSQGHRNIGYIDGPKDLWSAAERLRTFEKVMKDFRLPIKRSWLIPGDFHVEGGEEAMTKILKMTPRPTVVIAANDQMAAGALRAAHTLDVDVPRDISIVGFDNLSVCSMLNPPLSSIGVSREEIATYAFETLYKMAYAARKPRFVRPTIVSTFVARESTAHVRP